MTHATHSYTAAEINEIREELKRFLSAMADMGVVMKKPQAQVDSIRRDGIPAIDMLCDLAISALRGPSVPLEPTKAMLEAAGEAYFSGRPRPILQVCQAVLDIINGTPATTGGNK